MSDQFDASKLINCSDERDLFGKLLKFKDSKRILSIQDKRGGRGKSSLLKAFRQHCRTSARRIPVSLIDLAELQPATPFELVRRIVNDLGSQVTFAKYHQASQAYYAGDIETLRGLGSLSKLVVGPVSVGKIAEGASGIQIASQIYNVNVTLPESVGNSELLEFFAKLRASAPLDDEQKQEGQRVVTELFLEDIRQYLRDHRKRSVVVLFDTHERCEPAIKLWILRNFLGGLYFDQRSTRRLVVVVAGKDVPSIRSEYPEGDCDRVLVERDSLTRWEPKDVEDCIRSYGAGSSEIENLATSLHSVMTGFDLTPLQIVELIQSSSIPTSSP